MSYRNPQQVVDTQTGQHYRNLQKSLSNTFAGVAQSYKAEQDRLEKERKKKEAAEKAVRDFNQSEEDTIMNSVAKLKAQNPTLDTSAIYDMIDRYSDIKNAIDLGTITDKAELRKMREQLAQIRSIPDGLNTSLVGMGTLVEDLTESISKVGKKGGLDLESADPNILNQLNVFLNKTKGERRFQTQFDENNNMRAGIFLKSNKEGDKGKFYTKEELTSYMNGDIDGIPTIYDDTKDLDTMESMIVGKQQGTNTPFIKEAYLKEDKDVLKDGSIRINKVIDTEKVRKALMPQAVATINSLKPTELVSFYNNILSNGDKGKRISKEELNNNEVKEKIYKEYLEYAMQQRNLVDYKKKDYTYSPKTDKPGKPTQTEVDRQRAIEDLNYISKKLNDKDFNYSSKNLTDLATSFGVDYDADIMEDDDKTLRGSILKYGGKKITISKNDSRENIFKKILQLRVPGLQQKDYDNAIKELKKGDASKNLLEWLSLDYSWGKEITSKNGDNKRNVNTSTTKDFWGNPIQG